jgi:predicted RNase H-like HicB family nuclease
MLFELKLHLRGNNKMDYTVILHNAEEGGYWAEVPALDGCFSQGETVEDTMLNIKEAIQSQIIALEDEGIQPPKDQIMILSHIAV